MNAVGAGHAGAGGFSRQAQVPISEIMCGIAAARHARNPMDGWVAM